MLNFGLTSFCKLKMNSTYLFICPNPLLLLLPHLNQDLALP